MAPEVDDLGQPGRRFTAARWLRWWLTNGFLLVLGLGSGLLFWADHALLQGGNHAANVVRLPLYLNGVLGMAAIAWIWLVGLYYWRDVPQEIATFSKGVLLFNWHGRGRWIPRQQITAVCRYRHGTIMRLSDGDIWLPRDFGEYNTMVSTLQGLIVEEIVEPDWAMIFGEPSRLFQMLQQAQHDPPRP